MLADHFERGGERARAADLYRRAVEQAVLWGDTEAAITYARRGLACAPSDEHRLALLNVLWEAHLWGMDLASADVARDAEQMMVLATPGSGPWARGALLKLFGLMATGQPEAFTATLRAVRAVRPLPDAAAAVAGTLQKGIVHLLTNGQPEVAQHLLTWLEAIVEPVAELDPRGRGLRDLARSFHVIYADEDPWSGLQWAEVALESLEQAGSQADIARARAHVAMGLWLLGAYARAEQTARKALLCADEEVWIAVGNHFLILGWILIGKGEIEEARLIAEAMIDAGRVRRVAFYEGMGRTLLAQALFERGDLETAEREALSALGALSSAPPRRLVLIRTLAAIRLAQGRVAEALADAEEALAGYEALRMFYSKGSLARLIHAEALMAAGDQRRAVAAIAKARAHLLANAATRARSSSRARGSARRDRRARRSCGARSRRVCRPSPLAADHARELSWPDGDYGASVTTSVSPQPMVLWHTGSPAAQSGATPPVMRDRDRQRAPSASHSDSISQVSVSGWTPRSSKRLMSWPLVVCGLPSPQ
ncbi:hypothetical protein BE20_07210 [Sorangium cellulosum]|nr:hypothetical protein BE20_07210 [Sorangium cellulosum]